MTSMSSEPTGLMHWRFNTKAKDRYERWHFIDVDGQEYLVESVICTVPCWTDSDYYQGELKYEMVASGRMVLIDNGNAAMVIA